MPATSKAQYRFMAAVEHGGIRKKGLSPAKAAEFVDMVDYKSLPSRKKVSKHDGRRWAMRRLGLHKASMKS